MSCENKVRYKSKEKALKRKRYMIKTEKNATAFNL
jgi:hypothetical protein